MPTRYPAKARLVKHVTEDGVCGIRPEIPLGTIYMVDPLSICKMVWSHPPTQPGVEVVHESIWADANEYGPAGWMVLSMLKLETN